MTCLLDGELQSSECLVSSAREKNVCGFSSTVTGRYRDSIYTCETWSVHR